MSELTKLLSEHEVASMLDVTAHTLRCWRWAGRGPLYTKIGRKVKYLPLLLDQWIEEQTKKPGARHEETTAGIENQERMLALPRDPSRLSLDRKHRLGGHQTKRLRRLGSDFEGAGGDQERAG